MAPHLTAFHLVPLLSVLALTGASADLVAHYQFESNGDDSIGAADGTPGANVTYDTGLVGQAAVFGVSGVEATETINAAAFDPGAGDFSIAFWVKRDQNDDADADGIFDALNNTGEGYQANFRSGTDLDKMGFRLDASNGQFVLVVDPDPMADTEDWHHFALTVNRTANEAKIYRDGALAVTASTATLTGTISPDRQLSIGGLNNSSALGLDGKLDDLRFYDEALDSGAIEALATPPTGKPFNITRITVTDKGVTLTWNSKPGADVRYSIFYTENLGAPRSSWGEANDSVMSQGDETTYPLSGNQLPLPLPAQLFFVVVEN